MIKVIFTILGIFWLICIVACIVTALWIEKPVWVDENNEIIDDEEQ